VRPWEFCGAVSAKAKSSVTATENASGAAINPSPNLRRWQQLSGDVQIMRKSRRIHDAPAGARRMFQVRSQRRTGETVERNDVDAESNDVPAFT
jgi:hypothetical protein